MSLDTRALAIDGTDLDVLDELSTAIEGLARRDEYQTLANAAMRIIDVLARDKSPRGRQRLERIGLRLMMKAQGDAPPPLPGVPNVESRGGTVPEPPPLPSMKR